MITLKVDSGDLKELAARLRKEADGKALRKDLMRSLKGAMAPAVSDARGAAMSLPGGNAVADGKPLRAAIASRIVSEVRLSGRSPGVRVKAKRSGMPRGFALAARRTDRAAGWRHPVYGRKTFVHQSGRAHWWENVFDRRRPVLRQAVLKAMSTTAKRITRR